MTCSYEREMRAIWQIKSPEKRAKGRREGHAYNSRKGNPVSLFGAFLRKAFPWFYFTSWCTIFLSVTSCKTAPKSDRDQETGRCLGILTLFALIKIQNSFSRTGSQKEESEWAWKNARRWTDPFFANPG